MPFSELKVFDYVKLPHVVAFIIFGLQVIFYFLDKIFVSFSSFLCR